MTVPVTAGTEPTRSDAAQTFKTQITDVVNAISKWHSGSNPGGTGTPPSPLPGIPGGWTQTTTISSYFPGPLISNLSVGTVVSTSPTAAEIALGNISISALGTLLKNTAIALSKCRNTQLRKFYLDNNSPTPAPGDLLYNVTNPAHLVPIYGLSTTGVTNPSGNLSASGFNTFVTQLQTAVTNHRNTVVTFDEYWCHNSCHSNHSSRSRR